MSKQSTCFEIGFAFGRVVREFRRALSFPPVAVQAPPPVALSVRRIEPALLAGPTAKELEHISDVPAIVRLKKVNLNDWYLANTREVQKPKRTRKPKPAQEPPRAETPVRKELKLGSLDHLIAPNSESEMGRPPLQLESLNDHEIALLPAPPGSAVSWELHRRTQEQYNQRWQDYLSTMTDEQVAALGR
ncbi:hypothetical protein ACM7JY_18345 [Pseudomonas aeruginosa]|uniref:hypothetical protein n=1 Tax=Pseudomonas aeruginosa TaxID=287 RepID=UPI000F53D4C8|nr:hypothetical protein [Pseudomonas aeruginosa]MDY1459031.1 hypothetical protein [Pseudomonas aeruginosa]RQJ16101.1 hypothetical protein IPC5_20795 [Pseudomonas aeruginosa]RQJ47588.1 hypothetical protein IPC4_16905 [Pseudomonas aeruginosa]RTX37501.1 hypothetical protein DZA22_19130 [Pseudomonas aeruginosa]HCE8344070.1 hypothetical protein [Pseudomonas aeruginosa]